MRRYVTLGLVLVVVLTGCGGGGGAGESTGSPLTGTATAAELTDDARTEAGLTERRRRTDQLNTTVSATIQGDVELRTTRRANVTTVSVSYDGGESEGEDGVVFGTYSVPAVQPFERANLTKNPADGLDPATLTTRAQHRYAVRETTEVGQTTTTVLGTETTATRYEATAASDDEQRLFVTVATVRHANDYVTAVVVVPAGASAPTATLFGGVMH